MASALGLEFDCIHNELATLHWAWQQFCQLFVNSETDFKLFNERLPGFVLLTHTVLVDTVTLGLCRLTAGSGDKSNLSFDQLRTVLSATIDGNHLAWLDTEIQKIKKAVEPLAKHRNKRIGHNDLAHLLNASSILPKVSRREIESTLELMRGALNRIRTWKNEPETDYSHVISLGDADGLIQCIRQADRLRELQDDCHLGRLPTQQLIDKLKDRQFSVGTKCGS